MQCDWCKGNELYEKYHDEEWGVPVYEDRVHFEFLVLESAQAGLSWLTILKKRENYRAAYDEFDPIKVQKYDAVKIESLMNNPGIVRNRRKIEASINNAKCFLEIQKEYGSFSNYLWHFVENKPLVNYFESVSELPAKTEIAEKISKDLKMRGMKFLGPTIMYSHMQATGIVNDHIITCPRHGEVQKFSR